MKYSDCEKCIHAKLSTKGGMVMKHGAMFIQQKGAKCLTCRAGTIKNITMTDEGMICSSFREKELKNGIPKQRGLP